jgi:hypothetical protein
MTLKSTPAIMGIFSLQGTFRIAPIQAPHSSWAIGHSTAKQSHGQLR